jgi:hypothetical protein
MDREERLERQKKLEFLDSLKADPHISEASDVELNVEPKVLSSHLFKFGLNVHNLNAVVEGFKETADKQQEEIDEIREA